MNDHFFRVQSDISITARAMAVYAYRQRGVTKFTIIHDVDNQAYSKTYRTAFVETMYALGGQLFGDFGFSSSANPGFAPLVAGV